MRYGALGLAAVVLAAGCGSKPDVLATVGDRQITEQDFEQAFQRLSPSEQVEVLSPGGRLSLVERLVDKDLLEQAAERMGAPGSEWWVSLYQDAALSASWTEQRFSAYMQENPDMEDFIDLSRTFSLEVILLPDSMGAVHALDAWGSPDFPAGMPMALAPWSMGGSSYRRMDGYLWQFPADIEEAFSGHAGTGPFIAPLYGVWAVAELETGQEALLDSVPPEVAVSAFQKVLKSELALDPRSTAIEALARRLSVEGGQYGMTDTSGIDRSEVLAFYAGGQVTAGDMVDLATRTGRWRFFGNPPAELSAFLPPDQSGAGAGIDLWYYVSSVAQTRWAADRARSEGVPDSILAPVAAMASVEHLLRLNVLDAVEAPDSAEVMAWYDSNGASYMIPERRSALLAYIPEEAADSIGTPDSFDELSSWTFVDESGSPAPTEPQPAEAFGAIADAVFSQSPGVVCGPLEMGVEGARAYFQVVEILPEQQAEPAEIWGILSDDCRAVRIQETFDAFMEELAADMGVEIDTSAVENVDPWSGSY